MTKRVLLFFAFSFSFLLVSAKTDSLAIPFSEQTDLLQKAMRYNEIARKLASSDPDSALYYSRMGYRMALELKNDTVADQSIYIIGVAFDYKNQIDSSLFYYNLGMQQARKRGDENRVNDFVFAKGAAHYYQGNYAEALQYYDEALQFWENSGNIEKQGKALNNIAIVYRLRNNYDQAIDIYLRSLAIKIETQDTLGLANTYSNLGRAYYFRDRYDESMESLQKSLGFFEWLRMPYQIATIQSAMGTTLVAMKQFDEAASYFKKALPELEKKFTLDLLSAYMSLSIIEREKGNPEAALQLIEPYYDAVTQLDRINSRLDFEKEMYACYRDLKNFEKAVFHLDNYLELYKTSADENKVRMAEEMQTRFETREKENTIRLQELEIEKGDREKQTLFFGVAFALLAIVAMVVFAFSKIRSNRKLSAEKAKTEALLRDRETLLREIHHRVKNNLQVVSSLLSIQGREITDDKAQQAVNESRNRVHSMALIHQFLYGEQNVSSIDMPEYVGQLSRKLFSTYQIDHDQVQLHVEVDPILLDVDTAIPVGLIINELITNSLKYAFPGDREGNLWVSLKESEEVLILQVRDDGVGAKDAVPKSSSFGMKLLNAFKQKLAAEFDIVNESGMTIDYRIRKYKTA